MAHRSILTSIWTSVLAALVALLSSLGLGGKVAPAAAAASVPAPARTVPTTASVRRPAVAARRTWRAMMRGGSLPPTIKQRIRAEAHGKTPSVRRSTTAAAMGAGQVTATAAATRTLTSVAAPAVPAVTAPATAAPAATTGAAREALALAA
ncbi:DUF6344 domain-containing protein [Streptomyces sp. NBC_01294]|uniref:DUF6344 domain-containing protein n=1 Tax=Streptomyces sp. NBC_01294 TaxID=2903815 RepID=UPI002DD96FB9|nr:DUF6344 domain-containing protein [Streptomyces sp. NBC_01294]WRZ58385.1 DUF6344 domain-containing protein [Streptomyces sp. NBC_01294]